MKTIEQKLLNLYLLGKKVARAIDSNDPNANKIAEEAHDLADEITKEYNAAMEQLAEFTINRSPLTPKEIEQVEAIIKEYNL